jgi:hypothetical protein
VKIKSIVNNPPQYFEITHEEFVYYERYKDISIGFNDFFAEFKVQGQHNSRSRKNRIGSKLKYEFILPEELIDSDDEEVDIELVDDEAQSPTFLPQFEQLTLQSQASSSATASCSSEEQNQMRAVNILHR